MAGPEWPPSPWRLLRSLAAAWFDANPPPVTEAERNDLLQALGGASPPAMWLPPVSFAEVPYYQPIVDKTRKRKRVLHFDHFAVLSEGDQGACFCFDYDVGLSARQQSTLASLLARIAYFGRVESRARLSLVEAPPEHLQQATRADRYVPRRVKSDDGCWSPATPSALPTFGGWSPVVVISWQAMIEEGRKRPPNTEWIDYALPQVLVRAQLPRRQTTAEPEERRRVCNGAVRVVPPYSNPPAGSRTSGSRYPRSGRQELQGQDRSNVPTAHWPRG